MDLLVGSISASRFGIMNGPFELILPSAASTSPHVSLSLMVKVRSSTASIDSTTAIICWPMPSFLPRRAMEAMQSPGVTELPSCHLRRERSLMVQVLPSSLTVADSAIWGCTSNFSSVANSVSQIM